MKRETTTPHSKTIQFHAAPLEGISNRPFRELCFEYGADVTYTEMIRVEGIVRKNKSTLSMLSDITTNVPTVLQLLLVKPVSAQKFVSMFKSLNISPVAINLNLGCPSPEVICEGGGAALIKRIDRVKELVSIVQKIGLPITIKLRLGLNGYEKDKKIYLHLIHQVNADAFIIHARHGREKSSTPADWSVFSELLDTGKNIIANGDINTPSDVSYFSKMGISSVMIGRAAVRNPSIFSLMKGGKLIPKEEIIKRYEELCKLYPSHPKYAANFKKYLGKRVEVGSG